MKIFISMAMKNKSVAQVRQEMIRIFEKIKEKLPEAELIDQTINNADYDIAIKGDSVALWYLAKSLEKMAEADMVFFVDYWQKASRGCFIERKAAESYGKIVVDWGGGNLKTSGEK